MTSPAIPDEKLPSVVLGKDRDYGRAQAIAQLGTSDRPDRESLLTQVLENSYESRRYRAVAASALGRIATPEAEEILLRNLPKTSDDSFRELVLSLGRIGGPEVLASIESLNLREDHPGADAAAFAASLIAYRWNLPGHEVPDPEPADLLHRPTTERKQIDIGPADAATVRSVLRAIEQQPYGIAVDAQSLISARCAGQNNVICPNVELSRQDAESFTRGKSILAIVAVQGAESEQYSLSSVVLSRPAGPDALALTVHRNSGRLVMAGIARVSDGRLDFELAATRRPGARAIFIRGTIFEGGLVIDDAVSTAVQEPRRIPGLRRG